MIPPSLPSLPARRGFTLAELMVSIAVFTIILLLTAQVSDSALAVMRSTTTQLAAQREASVAAHQLRLDFAERIRRPDSPIRFDKNTGNDSLALLTKRPGYPDRTSTPDRAVSLAEYRIETDAATASSNGLLRAGSGFAFGSLTGRPAFDDGTLSLFSLGTDGPGALDRGSFQMLAPGVIRLELSFLVNDRDQPVRMAPPDDQALIDAVIATVGILDPERRGPLRDTQLTRISEQFADSVDGRLPLTDWHQTLDRLASKLPDLPAATLRQVRVQQILIPLHHRTR